MSKWVIDLELTKKQFIIQLCVLYIVLGTIMEELSMIVMTVPIILPMLKALGIDLIWFGVIIVMLVQIAIVSPPVGMNLFILHAMRREMAGPSAEPPISDIFIGVMPFFVAMIVALALVIAFPQIALWLPGTAN
jgi:TRAP-type C4-dicarboxylate transport system permease large subunit